MMLPEVLSPNRTSYGYRTRAYLPFHRTLLNRSLYLLQIREPHTGAGDWWVFLDLSLARRMAQVSS